MTARDWLDTMWAYNSAPLPVQDAMRDCLEATRVPGWRSKINSRVDALASHHRVVFVTLAEYIASRGVIDAHDILNVLEGDAHERHD